jgi:hypothetical protein
MDARIVLEEFQIPAHSAPAGKCSPLMRGTPLEKVYSERWTTEHDEETKSSGRSSPSRNSKQPPSPQRMSPLRFLLKKKQRVGFFPNGEEILTVRDVFGGQAVNKSELNKMLAYFS